MCLVNFRLLRLSFSHDVERAMTVNRDEGRIIVKTRVGFRSRTGLTKRVALLATPLVFQNISHTLLGIADTYFVSRVSTEALAAVGLATILFFAVLMLFRGTANSSVVFVGRAHGAKDDAKIGVAVWHVLNMVVLLSLVALVLPLLFGWLFSYAAPANNPLVQNLGTSYLKIRAFEIPFVMFSAVVWGFLVGRGDSRTPMILAWITVLLNIVLDWILVLGNLGLPAFGVVGAAYATLFSNVVNAGLSAAILWRPISRRRYKTGQAKLAKWSDLKQVIRIGLPMGLGDTLEIAAFSVFFAIMGRISTEALAANQIALQYLSLSFTIGIAFGMATSSLVAQQLGANRPELAEKVGYRGTVLGMIAMGSIGLGYLIAPAALIGLFSSEHEVISVGVSILKLVALYQVFDAVAIVLAGALNGAGDTTFTLLARTVLGWGLFIPLVWFWVFRLDGGVREAWIGALIYLIGLGLVYLIRFRSGRWKSIELS
jgi:MATE family multidrug resistance protein